MLYLPNVKTLSLILSTLYRLRPLLPRHLLCAPSSSGCVYSRKWTDPSSLSIPDKPDPLGYTRASQHQDDSTLSRQKKDAKTNWKSQVVFYVFNPALVGSNLADTVTASSLVAMWFMPVNLLLSYIVGPGLGWILLKVTRAPPHLYSIILGVCSAGNVGNLLIIIVPAICKVSGNPFGDSATCSTNGLAYASLSMAIGAIYIWTYVYNIMRISIVAPPANINGSRAYLEIAGETSEVLEESHTGALFPYRSDENVKVPFHVKCMEKLKIFAEKINLKNIFAPSTCGALSGFFVGLVPPVRDLIIGDSAPLQVIAKSAALVGHCFEKSKDDQEGEERCQLGEWGCCGYACSTFKRSGSSHCQGTFLISWETIGSLTITASPNLANILRVPSLRHLSVLSQNQDVEASQALLSEHGSVLSKQDSRPFFSRLTSWALGEDKPPLHEEVVGEGYITYGCSFTQTVFNGVNVLAGVGLLSTPYPVKEAGWVSLALLGLFAVVCCYTGVLLKYCFESKEGIASYPDIGEAAYGRFGCVLISGHQQV